jgi:hypothetical protein
VILGAIAEAQKSGARLGRVYAELGLDARTVQRWLVQGEHGEDRRCGPKSEPANKLSPAERKQVLELDRQADQDRPGRAG